MPPTPPDGRARVVFAAVCAAAIAAVLAIVFLSDAGPTRTGGEPDPPSTGSLPSGAP
ncbi:hypothetical protein [Chthonobacter rhizosphaerae]|uniref:hypothetical protein n=1 Tax=Chthonobacter rhizosphaerae TaxID=2735553 RepID=UPI0015EEEC60|nr:hypothetical protein [Chthonobacter rhizosphaerae]